MKKNTKIVVQTVVNLYNICAFIYPLCYVPYGATGDVAEPEARPAGPACTDAIMFFI